MGGGLCLYRPHPVEESFQRQPRCLPCKPPCNPGGPCGGAGMGRGDGMTASLAPWGGQLEAGRWYDRLPCRAGAMPGQLVAWRGAIPCLAPNSQPASQPPGQPPHYMGCGCRVRQDFGCWTKPDKAGQSWCSNENISLTHTAIAWTNPLSSPPAMCGAANVFPILKIQSIRLVRHPAAYIIP